MRSKQTLTDMWGKETEDEVVMEVGVHDRIQDRCC